jgi:hypothetical protein
MIFKPRKFRNFKTLINMKFTLAIAFGFMATAYGFRVKTTQDDICTTSDAMVMDDCSYVNTYCDPKDGTASGTTIGTCSNGNTTSSTCDYVYESDGNSGHCTNSVCDADGVICDLCNSEYKNSWSEDGEGEKYSSNTCTFANGTITGKLAYFIYHCISLCPFY